MAGRGQVCRPCCCRCASCFVAHLSTSSIDLKSLRGKPSKKKAEAMVKAAEIMHVELKNHGVLKQADYNKSTWDDWKKQNGEVS